MDLIFAQYWPVLVHPQGAFLIFKKATYSLNRVTPQVGVILAKKYPPQ